MADLHENKLHGRLAFPFTVYRGKLPEYIRSYPLHWHEEMELICVTEGTGIVTVQAERHRVHTGDIILIPPQTVHGIEQLDGMTMDYYNILFRLSMLEGEAGNAYESYIQPLSRMLPQQLTQEDPLNQALAPHLGELIEHRKQTDSDYVLMIRAHLYAALYHIVHSSRAYSSENIHLHNNYDKLKVVLEYIRLHYPEELTVRQAAAMCGFSDSHFMKLFRELTGASFAQYVKRLRLEAAADRLRSTGQRIGEVAEAVGFRNLSYFTRAFETQYGVSPTAYRETGT